MTKPFLLCRLTPPFITGAKRSRVYGGEMTTKTAKKRIRPVAKAIKQARTTKLGNSIDVIIHDIHNNLQVIKMETELSLIDPQTAQRTDRIFGAVGSIHRLLGDLWQQWLIDKKD